MTHIIIGENRKYSFKENLEQLSTRCFNVVLTSAKFKLKKLNRIVQDRQVSNPSKKANDLYIWFPVWGIKSVLESWACSRFQMQGRCWNPGCCHYDFGAGGCHIWNEVIVPTWQEHCEIHCEFHSFTISFIVNSLWNNTSDNAWPKVGIVFPWGNTI